MDEQYTRFLTFIKDNKLYDIPVSKAVSLFAYGSPRQIEEAREDNGKETSKHQSL